MMASVAATVGTGHRPSEVAAKGRGRCGAWYDARPLGSQWSQSPCVERALQNGYTGLVLARPDRQDLSHRLPSHVLIIVDVETADALQDLVALREGMARREAHQDRWVAISRNSDVLSAAKLEGFATCLHAEVADAASLHVAIECGLRFDYLLLKLYDPTNIPLELAIATLQSTNTVLINELSESASLHDALISFGVMEVGADGVMFSPRDVSLIDEFMKLLPRVHADRLDLSAATVTRVEAVGMGHRACVDLATIFSPREGMLIGSTSQGGILCCPEVFHLPYMELRPFRVNAGGVHAYVFNEGNRTNYLSELRAGARAMIVGIDGRTRVAPVGRVKIEVRPLRLIEAEFASGRQVNVLLQDDWHVRVYSAQDPGPLHVTELNPGMQLLGFEGKPGRHVGISVEEELTER